MPSDDELRRVAEDVRALARSLGRDLRAALDRSRDGTYGPRGSSTGPGPDGADSLGPEGGARLPGVSETSGPSGPTGPRGRRTAREDLRAARSELRQAQLAVRQSIYRHRHGGYSSDLGGRDLGGRDLGEGELQGPSLRYGGPGPGCPPRWDNWGRRRYREPGMVRPGDHSGVRPGGRGWSGRPNGPLASNTAVAERAPAVAPTPQPPLRHRHDGSTLLGLLALVFGLAWLAAGTHLVQVSTEAVVAIALLVLGAGTVVTARTDWALSRRTWPVLGGAALALALLALSASSSVPVGFRHLEFGSRTVAPATWAGVPPSIHGGFGRTLVDLTRLSPPAQPTTLAVDSAAGRLEIDVPVTLQVIVDARVTAGMLNINGVRISGVGRSDHEVLNPSAPGPPLTLHVQSGFGSVAIITGAAPVPSGDLVPSGGEVPAGGTPPTAPTLPPVPTGPAALMVPAALR